MINTITLYAPIDSLPSKAIHPPTNMLAVKANRIAILINGTNEADSVIADWLALRYVSEASLTLSISRFSAVNDLMVVIPLKLLFKSELRSATSSLTRVYLSPILL